MYRRNIIVSVLVSDLITETDNRFGDEFSKRPWMGDRARTVMSAVRQFFTSLIPLYYRFNSSIYSKDLIANPKNPCFENTCFTV